MHSYLKHYIDGQWVDSLGGQRHLVINPANEAPCTEITLGSRADVDAAISAARQAFESWSFSSLEERKAQLLRILEIYERRIPDIAVAISEEMGAPIALCMAAQAPAGILHLRATLDALDRFTFAEKIGDIQVVHEPVGVIAMITPWNWPINQIMAKVAPALAAGNTMVLKPSEEAPSCAAILAEIMDEAGVPAGVFNLVNGNGTDVGEALTSHPGVDMVSFTGSTRAGIAIARAAASTVKRVHQELGGKAANIVLPDADLADVLPKTIDGVLRNSGQSCIAPTRVLVHRDSVDEATAIIRDIMEAAEVADPAQEGWHIGPVVNKAQFDKIQGLIQSAIDEGAKLVVGGTGRPEGMDTGYYIRPTLFSDVTPDMRIAREEVFGPVATIMTYTDIDDAIRIANDTEYGLSATISGDPAKAAAIAPRLRAGIVTINDWRPNPIAPFGGYKQSGNGRENGIYGLADFMEVKSIIGAPA